MILWHSGLTMLIVWFVMRGNRRVDYRVVAIAALIPDLIDKPLGKIILRDRFDSGRIFGHSLLLNVALFCVLFFMRGRAKRQFTLVPISSLLHLAEDGMWNYPRVFWWPLFGTTFPRQPGYRLSSLLNPGLFIQEAIGLAVILFLLSAHEMLNRRGIEAFLRTGHLEGAEAPA
jgi:inner membrane protein